MKWTKHRTKSLITIKFYNEKNCNYVTALLKCFSKHTTSCVHITTCQQKLQNFDKNGTKQYKILQQWNKTESWVINYLKKSLRYLCEIWLPFSDIVCGLFIGRSLNIIWIIDHVTRRLLWNLPGNLSLPFLTVNQKRFPIHQSLKNQIAKTKLCLLLMNSDQNWYQLLQSPHLWIPVPKKFKDTNVLAKFYSMFNL